MFSWKTILFTVLIVWSLTPQVAAQPQKCLDFQEVRPDVYVAKDESGSYLNFSRYQTNEFNVAQCFYQRYSDRDYYDFMFVDQATWVPVTTRSYLFAARAGGIYEKRFDGSRQLGSQGRLAVIAWGNKELSNTIPSWGIEDSDYYTVNHEFSHFGSCYHKPFSKIFGAGFHISNFLGTASDLSTEKPFYGLMEDRPYQVRGEKASYDTRHGSALDKASDFTLYMLGFKGRDEIRGKFPLIGNGKEIPGSGTYEGDVVGWVGIDDLIQAQFGKRWPEATFSQRHFRAAFILLINVGDLETLKFGVQNLINNFIFRTEHVSEKWYEVMGGRSTLNDTRFKIPTLIIDKLQFKPGERLIIGLSGAEPNTEGLLRAYDGQKEYLVSVRTDTNGNWAFMANLSEGDVAQWSVVVYFGPDRETGGLTHTTSNLLYFEVVPKNDFEAGRQVEYLVLPTSDTGR